MSATFYRSRRLLQRLSQMGKKRLAEKEGAQAADY